MRFRATLFTLLLLALTGCAGAASTPESVPPTPTLRTPSPTAAPTPTQELEPMIVTIGLWLPEELKPYGDRPGAALLAQQLDAFSEAYPDLQVEVVVKKAHGRGGLLDFLRTARDAAPSVLPDLVVLDAAELETAVGSGLIQPLDDLLSPAEMTDRFSFASELGTVDGQTAGFVIGSDMQHLAYRPALRESPPISWTQIISPPIPFLFPAGGRERQVNDTTMIQYLAAGGTLADSEGKPTLDQTVMISVLRFYSDCVSTGAISPTAVLNLSDAGQSWGLFQEEMGEIAVVQAGQYWLETDETTAPAPIPTRDGLPLSIGRGWAIAMVTQDPARQSLAKLLLDWLIAPYHNGPWTQAAGYLPATRGALRVWDITNEDRAVLRSVLESALPPPRQEVMETTGTAMQQAVEAVLRGRSSPEEAAIAAVKSLEE
jgi:ABC-type glycerol-3-phosphate transport system substrate-binding protein